MTINNIDTNTAGTFKSFDVSDPKVGSKPNKAFDDGFIAQNTGNSNNSNGFISDELANYLSRPIDIETGSGDNQVIFNGPVNSPLNIDTGSGKDHVVLKQSPGWPGPHTAIVQADETGITVGKYGNRDYVNFTKDGTASINSQTMEEGRPYELADGGTAELKNGEVTLTTGDGYTIKQTTDEAHRIISTTESTTDVFPQSPLRPNMLTDTDLGSGNDQIEVTADGIHTVDLGTGDDIAFVGYNDGASGNIATINGGDGNDRVTLAGNRSDYAASKEDGYNVYTDQDGNTTKVAEDVEDVRFLMDDLAWDENPGDFGDLILDGTPIKSYSF